MRKPKALPRCKFLCSFTKNWYKIVVLVPHSLSTFTAVLLYAFEYFKGCRFWFQIFSDHWSTPFYLSSLHYQIFALL